MVAITDAELMVRKTMQKESFAGPAKFDGGCYFCEGKITAGEPVSYWKNPSTGKFRVFHGVCPGAEVETAAEEVKAFGEEILTAAEEVNAASERRAATAEPASTRTIAPMACPLCGTDRASDGRTFSAQEWPRRSLSQHKRHCKRVPTAAGVAEPPAAAAPAGEYRDGLYLSKDSPHYFVVIRGDEYAISYFNDLANGKDASYEEAMANVVAIGATWSKNVHAVSMLAKGQIVPDDRPIARPGGTTKAPDTRKPKPEPAEVVPLVSPLERVSGKGNTLKPVFSKAGLALIDTILNLFPLPTLLLGPTGMGKSVALREATMRLAKDLGRDPGTDFYPSAMNFHPATDIAQPVGFQRPRNVQDEHGKPLGIALEWTDGVLSKCVREGRPFLAEELTRSPETLSRLFSLLDNGFRSWPTPENPEEHEAIVHPHFWFLASANPSGAGYTTNQLDAALASRFVILKVDEPIADEAAMMRQVIPNGIANRISKIVTDLRNNPETYPSTRDVSLSAKLISQGLAPAAALDAAITQKFPKHAEGITVIIKSHL
jgi:MoxR-like ATPase